MDVFDNMVGSVLGGVSFLGSLIGAYFVFSALTPGLSAPQSCQLSAIGIGIAAIPYFIHSSYQRSLLLKRISTKPKLTP